VRIEGGVARTKSGKFRGQKMPTWTVIFKIYSKIGYKELIYELSGCKNVLVSLI
jgi:hypothetical protein